VLKLQAEFMADAMWESFCKATEPERMRHYALRYEFWAAIRDRRDSVPKEHARDKEPTKGGA